MPLLDGKHVDADQIDPAKHRCIGTWRPPAIPDRFVISDFDLASKPFDEIAKLGETECPCGSSLNFPLHHQCVSLGKPFKHWQDGCFDEPQYVSMQKPPEPDAVPPPARPVRRDEVGPFNPNASHPKKMERPDPLTEEMERSRLEWARGEAGRIGVAQDNDIWLEAIAGPRVWETAFRAGMEYRKKLRPKPVFSPEPPRDQWFWKCVTCGNHCLQPHDAPRPTTCHERCPNPDWKLLKYQDSYVAGPPDWTHPDGEI